MRPNSPARVAGVLAVAGLLVTTSPATANPARAAPAPTTIVQPSSTTPTPQAVSPPVGSLLEPGRFYPGASLGPTTGGWRVTGQGDRQTNRWTPRWTIDFDDAAAARCAGGESPYLIGLLRRDGVGPFGGHVLTARFYRFDTNGYVGYRDFTGDQLLACFRTVMPSIPDGTAFDIVTQRLEQYWPAGAAGSNGRFDLVTASNGLGYMVAQYLPGKGWQPPAPIGGEGFEPAVLRLRDGTLRIFVRAQASPVLYTGDISPDRRFLGWRNWGGSLASNAAPVLMPDGSVAAYAVGTNRQVRQARWTASGVFRGWISLGSPPLESGRLPFVLMGAPAAASTGGGNVTLAVTNDGDQIRTHSYVEGRGWGGWVEPDPQLNPVWSAQPNSLAAVSAGDGSFYLYWSSARADIYLRVMTSRARNGRWSTPTSLGGQASHITASRIGGRVDLWVDGFSPTSVDMYQRTNVSGSWRPWVRLPYA